MRSYLPLLVLFSALFTFSPSVHAAAPPPPPPFAEVTFIRGKASLEPAHTNLKVGQGLKIGDRVTTMSGSMLRLKLADGAAMLLGPHTEIVLKRKEAGVPLLQLVHGMILSAVKPSADIGEEAQKKDRFILRTNKVSLGVRGTEFFVKQSGDEPTFLCVCNGKVHAKWQEGEITYESEHHDHYVNIRHTKKKPEKQNDMGSDHDDDQIAALKKLL